MTRWCPRLLCLACLLAVSGGVGPGEGEAPTLAEPDAARTVEGVVMEVIDGDSLGVIVDGELRRFEVLGADAPEWVEKDPTPSPMAGEARRFLTNMLRGERVAVFEPEPGVTDPLGRRRGYVFRLPDRAFVDLEIVRQGYGKVSTRAGEPYRDALRWYERRAKELERGVWGEPEETPAFTTPPPAETPQPVTLQPEAPKETPPVKPVSPEPLAWVWVTRSGTKYHREDCPHLSDSRRRVRLDEVRSTHEPCRTCHPDRDD